MKVLFDDWQIKENNNVSILLMGVVSFILSSHLNTINETWFMMTSDNNRECIIISPSWVLYIRLIKTSFMIINLKLLKILCIHIFTGCGNGGSFGIISQSGVQRESLKWGRKVTYPNKGGITITQMLTCNTVLNKRCIWCTYSFIPCQTI